MKRHPAFQDLSRDHYVVLNRVLQLERCIEDHPMARPYDVTLRGVMRLWETDGIADHLEHEEGELVPLLEQAGDEGLAVDLKAQHDEVRAALAALALDTRPSDAMAVAQILRTNVRWEEEVLFPWLQEHLGEDDLRASLQRSLAFRRGRRLPAACGLD